ncbi:MAG TPA: hypothetical protein VKB10_04860 [Gaiellaceae bacterium]|nr:hypothetical protein [Gaiellaceae bacterium]
MLDAGVGERLLERLVVAWPAVEAHGARQAVPAGRGEPRLPSAQAEPDREDGADVERVQMVDRRGDVGLDLLGVTASTCGR